MYQEVKPIRTLLIDDEAHARSIISEYLEEFPRFEIVGNCINGYEGLKAIQETRPDLIFLDIQMPRISGFEMLELIDNPPAIIFCTAYDEFALQAFDSLAIDYLLKPCTEQRFQKAISKFLKGFTEAEVVLKEAPEKLSKINNLLETQIKKSDRVVVKTGNNIRIIAAVEIQFLEADDDYVSIHTASETFIKNRTLAYFEKCFDDNEFVRVHRSFIIRIAEITRLELYQKDSYLAVLKSGVQIPVSRKGYAKLRETLGI